LRAKTRRVKVKGGETALTYKYNCGAPMNGWGPPDRGVRGCLATALPCLLEENFAKFAMTQIDHLHYKIVFNLKRLFLSW